MLRKALDEYIKQNLTQEDKQDLFNDVVKELDLFREKYPIVPELDDRGENKNYQSDKTRYRRLTAQRVGNE